MEKREKGVSYDSYRKGKKMLTNGSNLYHQTTEYRVTHNHQEKMPLTIGGKFMI